MLFLAVLAVPLVVAIRHSTELFQIKVEKGKTSLVRGRLPLRLYNDIKDIVHRPAVARATIRCVAESGEPRVLPDDGLDAGRLQRLRNVVGHFEIAQIRNGKLRS
jgi:hypothetical protein